MAISAMMRRSAGVEKYAGIRRRRMATIDGKVYGLPFTNIEMVSLLYRKDILRKSGIDPDKPPKDWEELYAILQKLTHPEMKIPGATIQHGQYGYALETPAFVFWSWLWAAGGDILVQDRVNPRTGKMISFRRRR